MTATRLELAQQYEDSLDIAVIGMAGRFPGAASIHEFWQNLRQGVSSIRRFSDEEMLRHGASPRWIKHPDYVNAGGELDDIEMFDAPFFGYSPREAEVMDPQKRLLLQCAWQAIEDAACDPTTYEGATGVFVGGGMNTYLLNNLYANQSLLESFGFHQVKVANHHDFLATSLSYAFDLQGPGVTVQSACSTSLVAIALAVQSLLNYQSDMALAGGVAVDVLKKRGYLYREDDILSPDGRCCAFDANAQGTVGGNGVGVVVLKRLADAIADENPVYAVIKGSAINNDGSRRLGFAAPGSAGQADVIRTALALADVDPATIRFVEAHGTGTPLGDPVELDALHAAYHGLIQKNRVCALGAVKTNIGHLDAAAGVAGFIKTVLSVYHGEIVPTLNYETPNPLIPFESSPFYVNTEHHAWPDDVPLRRASVSSFGLGGTNAHIILEEAPSLPVATPPDQTYVLTLSAKSDTALQERKRQLANFLRTHPQQHPGNVAYTLCQGRSDFPHRSAIIARYHQEAVEALEDEQQRWHVSGGVDIARSPVLCYMFTGFGEHYPGAGRQLYVQDAIFKTHFDACAIRIQDLFNVDIRSFLLSEEASNHTNLAQAIQVDLDEARTHPIYQPFPGYLFVFSLEYALAQRWIAWGCSPDIMIGHSLGEYVAACLANVFSLEDALYLVGLRAQLIQTCERGAMLAVPLPAAELDTYLQDDTISIAAINTPGLCILSGRTDAVTDLQNRLQADGILFRPLKTQYAYHSPLMESIKDAYIERVQEISLSAPTIPFISNVSGQPVTADEALTPHYWGRHLRQTVRFADGIAHLWRIPGIKMLEVGVGNSLSSMALQNPASHEVEHRVVVNSMPGQAQTRTEIKWLHRSLGQLWAAGLPVDLSTWFTNGSYQRLRLPTYPFDRERYWVEAQAASEQSAQTREQRRPHVADWFHTISWKQAPPLPAARFLDEPIRCLVLCHADETGTSLVEQLDLFGYETIVVRMGTASPNTADIADSAPNYVLQADAPDFDAILDDLSAQKRLPQLIVHAWYLHPAQARPHPTQIMSRGFYSLLALSQSLARVTRSLDLWVLTQESQFITEDVTANAPCQAMVQGIGTVISQEFLNIRYRQLDITLRADNSHWAAVIAEMQHCPYDQQIAHRNRRRWLRDVEPCPLPGADITSLPTRLREGGVYVITGGLGKIGLRVARYLTETWQARVALLSRTGLPERPEWSQILAAHAASPQDTMLRRQADRIREIQEMQASDENVLILQADVADRTQLQTAFADIEAYFGTINGVFHAAGYVGAMAHHVLESVTGETVEPHFASKIVGTRNLAAILADKPLDFCILFSSLASVIGGLGFAAYASANSFLDHFASQQNSQQPDVWISLNWEAWIFGEEEVIDSGFGQGLQLQALSPDEGIQVLEHLLRLPYHPQMIVSTTDLSSRIDKWHHPQQADAQKDAAGGRYERPALRNPYVPPRNELEVSIAEVWQTILGIDRVGIHDNFFEVGGNSLLGLQIVHRLREELNLSIPLTIVYEGPTIATMSKLLEETTQ